VIFDISIPATKSNDSKVRSVACQFEDYIHREKLVELDAKLSIAVSDLLCVPSCGEKMD
jgi:hypothetical protein